MFCFFVFFGVVVYTALVAALMYALATATAKELSIPSLSAAATTTKSASSGECCQATQPAKSNRRGLPAILPALIGNHRAQQARHFHRVVVLQLKHFYFRHILGAAIDRFNKFREVMNVMLRIGDDDGIAGIVRQA